MSSSLAKPGIRDSIVSDRQLWSSQKISTEIAAAIDPAMKSPEAFAPSGNYPTTYDGSPVEKGDTFRMTGAGTMGGITVNVEDLLIALVDTPAQVDANWMVAESNRDQATETVKGVAELATQAEADAGTNDTNIMTPLKTATAPVRAHDIDPGVGPHTGGLPEASVEFDDATGHAHTGASGSGTAIAHSDTSGQTEDDHHNRQHALGAAADHTSATLAELNSLVSDATLDDSGDPRDPNAHASEHVDGTDDIQNATAAQKGLATAAHIALLEKLENMPINNQIGTSYTPVLTDANKWIFCSNASPFSFTIPTNAAVAFPVGTAFPVVRGGTGSLTFLHPGVTVYGELTITDQYFVAVCKKLDTDTWIIVGGTGDPAIPETLFDANTILKADTDNTAAALTVPEQTLIGRITAGVITALMPAQVRTLINVSDGADVTGANPPQAHASTHENGGADEISVAGLSGQLADNQPALAHLLAGSKHTADTLANLNAKITDATLDDSSASRTPLAHASTHENGGADEISVAGLSGQLADNQNPTAHASEHVDGTDDIQNATAAQKGLATAAQITKLDGIATGADVTFDQIQEDIYNTSETDTGREWNGSTLYMKSFTGSVPNGIADLISGGINELVDVKGWANNGGTRNVTLPYHDGTNTAYVFKDTGTNDLSIFGAGAFVGQTYKITCFYTKT